MFDSEFELDKDLTSDPSEFVGFDNAEKYLNCFLVGDGAYYCQQIASSCFQFTQEPDCFMGCGTGTCLPFPNNRLVR